MRNNLELLIVLKKYLEDNFINGNQIFFFGLCYHLDDVCYYGMICDDEYVSLLCYLYDNKPDVETRYWWPKGEIKPRYEFICGLIKKLESC